MFALETIVSRVLARVYYVCVCARRCGSQDLENIVLARGTAKSDETRQLAPTRDERGVESISRRSRMRFFSARSARSRGLSRSQPVFVIIMLEKCMNICFN